MTKKLNNNQNSILAELISNGTIFGIELSEISKMKLSDLEFSIKSDSLESEDIIIANEMASFYERVKARIPNSTNKRISHSLVKIITPIDSHYDTFERLYWATHKNEFLAHEDAIVAKKEKEEYDSLKTDEYDILQRMKNIRDTDTVKVRRDVYVKMLAKYDAYSTKERIDYIRKTLIKNKLDISSLDKVIVARLAAKPTATKPTTSKPKEVVAPKKQEIITDIESIHIDLSEFC